MDDRNQSATWQSPQYIDSVTVPKPLFNLFEVAILHYESEFGEVSNELVQIVGLSWHPAQTRVVAWWYHVRYLNQPTGIEGHLSAGHQEDCLENELRRIVDVSV